MTLPNSIKIFTSEDFASKAEAETKYGYLEWLFHMLAGFKAAVGSASGGALGSLQQAFQGMTEHPMSAAFGSLPADTLLKPSRFIYCLLLPFCKRLEVSMGAAIGALLTGG